MRKAMEEENYNYLGILKAETTNQQIWKKH